jgi:hypothetical protein
MITDKYWLLPETLISLVSNGGAVGEQSLMRCLCSFHQQLSLLVQKFTHTVCKFVRLFVAIFKTHSGAAANSSICRHL